MAGAAAHKVGDVETNPGPITLNTKVWIGDICHKQIHVRKQNSQGLDKLNVRHLKHIGSLGLSFPTSMFKTALNLNTIPHTWKLANIVPIPNPNKDTDKGTSYRPISLLSVIAKTLEKSLLPYITANIPHSHATRVQNTTLYGDSTPHSCRSHATKTAFTSSTTLFCLSIHRAVAPEISASWYQYPFFRFPLIGPL